MALKGLGRYDREDGIKRMVLDGRRLDAEVSEAITGASIERTIDGSGNIAFNMMNAVKLLRSGLFDSRVFLRFDGLPWEFAELRKQGTGMATKFIPAGVGRLMRDRGVIVHRKGTTTRTQFAKSLVERAKPLDFRGQTGETNRKVMVRKKQESSWEALQRLALDREWRIFEDEGTIYFGSDAWLAGLGKPVEISEKQGGVDFIDIEYDGGMRANRATVYCRADTWAARPGRPVEVKGLGRLASSRLWLVERITKSDIFGPDAVVELIRKTPELPEPKPEPKGGASEEGFQWPMKGPITSTFGDGRNHAGIDIDGETGDPVVAAKSGKVTLATVASGYGNLVEIDHGGGWRTRYAHLHTFAVRVGQSVNRGNKVGTCGNTGRSTGSHLHFEIRKDGVAQDPKKYLP